MANYSIQYLRTQAEAERLRQQAAQQAALWPAYQQQLYQDQARAKEQARLDFEAQERARREAEARARAQQEAAAKARAEAEAAYLRQVGAMQPQPAPTVQQPLPVQQPQQPRPVAQPQPRPAPQPPPQPAQRQVIIEEEEAPAVDPTLYVVAGIAVVGAIMAWVYTRKTGAARVPDLHERYARGVPRSGQPAARVDPGAQGLQHGTVVRKGPPVPPVR